MRTLICFGFFFLMPFLVKAQEFTLVQINAKWNLKNNIELNIFDDVDYKFAYLEEQKSDIKSKINAVPVVILYKMDRQNYTRKSGELRKNGKVTQNWGDTMLKRNPTMLKRILC